MNGQRIGYIRVSTVDQRTERQLDGINLDKTFLDKVSGKDTKRPQLELLMSFARSGDTVIVHSMDRLARNLDDLRRIVQTLTGRGVVSCDYSSPPRTGVRSQSRVTQIRSVSPAAIAGVR